MSPDSRAHSRPVGAHGLPVGAHGLQPVRGETTPLAAIFYRHWLELRRPVVVLLVAAALMSLLFPWAVHGVSSYLAETGNLAREVRNVGPAVERMPRSLVVAWAVHVQCLVLVTVLVPLFVAGTGLSHPSPSGPLSPRHPSLLFTLSLPLSRATLVATRFAAALVVAMTLVILLLVMHVLGMLVVGPPVTLLAAQVATMVPSALRGLIAIALALASLGLLTVILREFWAGMVTALCTLAAFAWWWTSITHFIAGATVGQIAAALAGTVAIVGASIALARAKEY